MGSHTFSLLAVLYCKAKIMVFKDKNVAPALSSITGNSLIRGSAHHQLRWTEINFQPFTNERDGGFCRYRRMKAMLTKELTSVPEHPAD